MNNSILTIRKLYREHPVPGSIITAAVIIGIMKLNSLVLKMLLEGMVRDYLIVSLTILAAFFIVWLLGYTWIYRRGDAAKTAWAGLLQILFYGYLLTGTIMYSLSDPGIEWKPLPGILLGLLKLFQIGFLEESIFRGVISNGIGARYGKDTKGVWFTVVMSGFVFGAMHMSNIASGISFSSAFSQSVIAWLMGIYLVAVYLRGGNIWIMILIHAMTDSIGLFESYFTVTAKTDVDAVNGISFKGAAMFLIYLAVAVFLLRKSKMPEVIKNLQDAAEEDKAGGASG